jgi:hypothetical protein
MNERCTSGHLFRLRSCPDCVKLIERDTSVRAAQADEPGVPAGSPDMAPAKAARTPSAASLRVVRALRLYRRDRPLWPELPRRQIWRESWRAA